jgi:formylglycine-generating enzyme required for sulfatase activity
MKTARSFILLACAAAVAGAEPVAEKAAAPPAMAWIPGGAFLMGTNDKESFPNERPARLVQVQGFWME